MRLRLHLVAFALVAAIVGMARPALAQCTT
jgi:hypothetical protein